MAKKIQLAAIQMCSSDDVTDNCQRAEQLLAKAAAKGAKIAVLPESFGCMSRQDRDLLALREPEGQGRLQQFLADCACRYELWLVGGTVPLVADNLNKVRATCLVYRPDGVCVGRYDKRHLFDAQVTKKQSYQESAIFEAGQSSLSVATAFGRLAVAVCYDLRFPELFRELLTPGFELVALPAAFTATTGKAHWKSLLRARAIENQTYIIAANQWGQHPSGRTTYGHSLIVDPWGEILAVLPKGEGVVMAQFEPDRLEQLRQHFPVLSHRQIHCSSGNSQ